ncbi:MAG: hypothetical protein QXO03_02320 [Thermoplasmatales archaeon]
MPDSRHDVVNAPCSFDDISTDDKQGKCVIRVGMIYPTTALPNFLVHGFYYPSIATDHYNSKILFDG